MADRPQFLSEGTCDCCEKQALICTFADDDATSVCSECYEALKSAWDQDPEGCQAALDEAHRMLVEAVRDDGR